METVSQEFVILSYATVCPHQSVSLNNEKNCREISQDKIAVYEKTAGLQCSNVSGLNSTYFKVLLPIEIFHFSDMHYENSFLGKFQGLDMRPNLKYSQFVPYQK